MLRWLVVALLLANLAFWSWSEGWLRPLIGLGPTVQRESTRLAEQVQPDSVRVLSAAAASAALAAASAAQANQESMTAAQRAALKCLEAGPFPPAGLEAAEQVLAGALPARGWIRVSRDVTAQFVVFIGPLAGRDAMQKKLAELNALRVGHEELRLPGERDPGLALSRHDTREAAQAALDALIKRGVRSARVAVLREANTEWRLRVDNAAPAQADQLRALSLPGGAFAACAG